MLSFTGRKKRWYRWTLKYRDLKDSTGTFVAKGSKISSPVQIGDGTRINGRITIKGAGKITLGKYCAIGADVKIISSNHNPSDVNLQYWLSKQIGIQIKPVNAAVSVGHNVWIGDSVLILPGVSIGNGAILAAGSVITKDVEPYSIVAGVPAKHIRFRLEPSEIERIEQAQWWEWSLEKMKSNRTFFTSS